MVGKVTGQGEHIYMNMVEFVKCDLTGLVYNQLTSPDQPFNIPPHPVIATPPCILCTATSTPTLNLCILVTMSQHDCEHDTLPALGDYEESLWAYLRFPRWGPIPGTHFWCSECGRIDLPVEEVDNPESENLGRSYVAVCLVPI